MKIIHKKDQLQIYIEKFQLEDLLPPPIFTQIQLCLFEKGAYLCKEGEELPFLYLLVEGKCKVTKYLSNGKEQLLSFYHTFSVLGEFELIEKTTAKTNVQAIDNAYCLCIPVATTREFLMSSPSFMQFLCSYLCRKMIRNNQNSSINLNYTVEQRVASYIICTHQKTYFKDNYTHLAEYLGCSHRQLLRVLSKLCELEILKKEDGYYKVLDMDQLEGLAGDVYQIHTHPFV
ncbi:MAG: cyclic nucleotide-binding domain-containing protein [Bacillaceae bacterium]